MKLRSWQISVLLLFTGFIGLALIQFFKIEEVP
jgi:hypothetical protein